MFILLILLRILLGGPPVLKVNALYGGQRPLLAVPVPSGTTAIPSHNPKPRPLLADWPSVRSVKAGSRRKDISLAERRFGPVGIFRLIGCAALSITGNAPPSGVSLPGASLFAPFSVGLRGGRSSGGWQLLLHNRNSSSASITQRAAAAGGGRSRSGNNFKITVAYGRCLFPHAYPGAFSPKRLPPGPYVRSEGKETPFSRCPGGQDRAGPAVERPRPAGRGRGAGGWRELRVPCRPLRSQQSCNSPFPTPPNPVFWEPPRGTPGPAALGPAGGNHPGRLFRFGRNRPCVALPALCLPAVKMGDKFHHHPQRTNPHPQLLSAELLWPSNL